MQFHNKKILVLNVSNSVYGGGVFIHCFVMYGKCSKISNTLKLRTPKIITENNF